VTGCDAVMAATCISISWQYAFGVNASEGEGDPCDLSNLAGLKRSIQSELILPTAVSRSPNFVTFHVDVSTLSSVDPVHPNANLQHDEYLSMIDLMFRSARLFHREATFTMLTNSTARFAKISESFVRIDSDVRPEHIMLDRMRAQTEFAQSYDFSRPVILLDTDIIINRQLDELLAQDFDVGLTWRDEKMPINGGVIILNNRRPDAVRQFLTQVYKIYTELYAEQGKWFGDQLALHKYLNLNIQDMKNCPTVEVDGVRILFLPCETYNFSPENDITSIQTGLQDKLLLHFKGPRKLLMKLFWDADLLPKTRLSLVDRVRSWLARRKIARTRKVATAK
jgi:hypothetical protein